MVIRDCSDADVGSLCQAYPNHPFINPPEPDYFSSVSKEGDSKSNHQSSRDINRTRQPRSARFAPARARPEARQYEGSRKSAEDLANFVHEFCFKTCTNSLCNIGPWQHAVPRSYQ